MGCWRGCWRQRILLQRDQRAPFAAAAHYVARWARLNCCLPARYDRGTVLRNSANQRLPALPAACTCHAMHGHARIR